jgi:phosphatidylserine decarboxylase
MTLSVYGKREWLGGGILALTAVAAGIWMIRQGYPFRGGLTCGLAGAAWLAVALFFRVPNRRISSAPEELLSPADGVVRDVDTVTDHGIDAWAGRELVRIGIFLSVFDVHVNRAPCDLLVEQLQYRPGRHLDARDARCPRENESLTMTGTGFLPGLNTPIAIRQISGAIARRIVCEVQPGTRLEKGQIYGMIKFGSRTELFFPADERIRILAKEGQKVFSGKSALACVVTTET